MTVTIAWPSPLARELVEHGQEWLDDLLGPKPAVVERPAARRELSSLVRMVTQAKNHLRQVVGAPGWQVVRGGAPSLRARSSSATAGLRPERVGRPAASDRYTLAGTTSSALGELAKIPRHTSDGQT